MIFYDFDSQSALEEIKSKHQSIKEIKTKLADDRNKFRGFCSDIELDNYILFDCIDMYERTLLIDCYTYSEQLTKSLIYHLLNKDNNSNMYIETFIDKKINPERYSPNVRFKNLQDTVNDVYNGFKFILTNISEIEVYDDLIKNRHRYAHKGNYFFDFVNFTEVIDMLEYITFEFKLIENTEFDRITFKNCLCQFDEKLKEIKKDPSRPDIIELKKECNSFFYNNLYMDMLLKNKILKEKIYELEEKLFSIGLGLSDNEKEVFYILKENENLTVQDISKELEISEQIIVEILADLVTKGMREEINTVS